MGANLSEWRSALLSEYESLTVLTKAIEPIDAQELQGDTSVEYAPGKLVATVKALDGKKRPGLSAAETELSLLWTSRMSSSSTTTPTSSTREKTADTYAAGIDGASIRTTIKSAASRGWTAAGIDVKTAFLLAPRRGEGTLIVRPPEILVQAGVITQHEVWRARQALYGLQSSPGDWGAFSDDTMAKWKWMGPRGNYNLERTTEPNLWRIACKAGASATSENVEKDTKNNPTTVAMSSSMWTTFSFWELRTRCSQRWIRCRAFGAARHQAGCRRFR